MKDYYVWADYECDDDQWYVCEWNGKRLLVEKDVLMRFIRACVFAVIDKD